MDVQALIAKLPALPCTLPHYQPSWTWKPYWPWWNTTTITYDSIGGSTTTAKLLGPQTYTVSAANSASSSWKHSRHVL